MYTTPHPLATVTLNSTLALVDEIKQQWKTADLDDNEKWALEKWIQHAQICVIDHVLVLDGTDQQPLDSDLRATHCWLLARGRQDQDPVLELELQKKRVLPRLAYARIEEALHESELNAGKKYGHPSNLPFLDNWFYLALEETERATYSSPSLAFLAVDYHLDLIGGQLFKSSWPMQKAKILESGTAEQRRNVSLLERRRNKAIDFVNWGSHSGWERTRFELSRALKPAWPSHNDEYNKQHAILQDLERLFRVVCDGDSKTIPKTPGQLRRYILKSLKLLPRKIADNSWLTRAEEPEEAGLHFFDSTQTLLLASRFFGTDASAVHISHTHVAGESSTATSQSLGRISNKFVPQARSLPSHRPKLPYETLEK